MLPNVSDDDPADRTAPAGHVLLFCPADRPDRYRKALEAADAVIIDLEDAVSPDGKDRARDTLSDALSWLPLDRTVVRINSPRTETGATDLEMLLHSAARFVMVPKVESAEEIEMAAPLAVIALCETARGIQRVPLLANADGCVAVMWGGEDLTADIGGLRSRGSDGAYLPHVQYARSRTLVAAAAAGIAAWDGVYLDIADLAGLASETLDAVRMGFDAKVVIHPSHAAVVRRAYRPTDDQVRWAGELMEVVRAARSGVTTFDGRMVDGPLIQMAKNILLAAGLRQ